MAAALPLEPAALVGIGPFGERVTDILALSLAHTKVFPTVEQAFAADASVVVVSAWRPVSEICERADALAHAGATTWLPVVKEDPVLQVGPWVSPGAGPCFRCFEDRKSQHDPNWSDTASLYEAYDRDEALGPAGFLPQHARIAAGLAEGVIQHADEAVGQVVTASLWNLALSFDRVVAVHGCDRCGPSAPERDLRSMLRSGMEGRADVD